MRICIDARSLLEIKPSGISLYAGSLIQALLREYPEDVFVLFTNSFSDKRSLEQFRTFANCEIHETGFPNKLLHACFSLFRTPRLENIVGQCDVYFFPNVMFLPRLPKNSVLTVHDISYIQLPRSYSFRNHLWYRLVRARTLIREAGRIIVDSNGTRIALSQEFPEVCERTNVIHPALIRPSELIERKQATYFVVLGDIDERKNVFGILSAYEQVRKQKPDFPDLVFVGKRGYVNLRSSTLKVFNRLKALGWIRELGYVSEKEKWDILSHAVALVFASFYEGFGFPGLEAELLGVPIIASQRTCLPEIFGEGPLYVNPDNISSIAHAFITAMSLPRTIAYNNPLLQRTWNNVAQEMMNIFKTVAYENRH